MRITSLKKGGVGKTTVSIGLARAGKRTLPIDLDPQAHSTAIYRTEVPKDANVGAVLENRKADLSALVRPAEVKGRPGEDLDEPEEPYAGEMDALAALSPGDVGV